MANNPGQSTRMRSSTGASRGLNGHERESSTVTLVQKLANEARLDLAEWLLQIPAAVDALCQEFGNSSSAKDTFRHAAGFESILAVLESKTMGLEGKESMSVATACRAALLLLANATTDHRGNEKYFAEFLNGWLRLEKALEAHVLSSVDEGKGADADQLLAPIFEGLLIIGLGRHPVAVPTNGLTTNGDVYSAGETRYRSSEGETVINPAACAVALRLALHSLQGADTEGVISVACDILQLFSTVVDLNARNLNGVWKSGILTDLLLASEDGNIHAAAMPHIHNIVQSLATLGLNSLSDVAELFEKSCASERTRKLLLRSLKHSKQPAFVQFDLAMYGFSSIEFPCLARTFPSPTGYTMSAWVRIDNFDPSSHTTIFGAFDASQACFILMYLEKDSHQLILQTSMTSSRPSVRFKSSQFAPNRWYHVVLSHKRNPSDFRQSTAALFVDGEFQEQVKCAYPEAPPEHDDKIRSTPQTTSSSSSPRKQKSVQAFFGTPRDLSLRLGRNKVLSRWSLASAHLYSVPLTDEYIAVQYHLSPRYNGNMQDSLGPLLTYRASAELNRYNELLHPDKSEKSDIITATEGTGNEVVSESKFLISISPTSIIRFDGLSSTRQNIKHDLDRKAWSRYSQLSQHANAVAINAAISPRNEAITRTYGTGILMGDPVVCVPQSIDDATWCLTGSILVLIRLLESATTKDAFLESVQIFFECVRHNWRISEAMERGNGFGMLAVLIREKLCMDSGSQTGRKPSVGLSSEDCQTIPMELLQLVLDFVGYDREKPEDSMIVNPMAYRVLLLDFDTWRRCDVETQKLFYAQLMHFVCHNRHQSFNQKRLSRMRVVRKLIEALKSEDYVEEIMPSLIEALGALLEGTSSGPLYRELAMFVAYGLQDERTMLPKMPRSMPSIVALRQKTLSWARSVRSPRPTSPGVMQTPSTPQPTLSRVEFAIHVLELLESILRDDTTPNTARRFHKAVPNRWILHLLAETDERIVGLTMRILSRLIHALGADFKGPFMDKNGGFITLRNRLKSFWRLPAVWQTSFAIFFGRPTPDIVSGNDFTVFGLIGMFTVDDTLGVTNPEMLPSLMALLETGLRHMVRNSEPDENEARIMKTVVQFLSELYNRSTRFRDFAANSRYVQEILFVLFPILVGSDRLSTETELQSNKESLSFKGEEVHLRPHSNSLGERPPSVRSTTSDSINRAPSPRGPMRIEAPRRPSSFILVHQSADKSNVEPAQFNALMAPKKTNAISISVSNSIVESLMEVAINMFVDLVCHKDRFNGIGLFLKVPPGFREHQAYFESYILVHTLTQLWNYLQLNQQLLVETRVITNLSRFCTHMSEAVFEGWFIDGGQPLLDFSGKLLEYLQQSDIAAVKSVRLCSQNINAIRVVFMRVCLWRLSELDEIEAEQETTAFLNGMNYWQTILFSSDNRETLFTRLICFLLYTKLVSDANAVRLAAARLWRAILVQKPTETATLLTLVMGADQRHLSTGFMNLLSMDDEDFIKWIDDHRSGLDKVFLDALSKPWDEFVNDENRRTEESAKNRLSKRKDKLRQWQVEEVGADDFMHRYEISTNHWRSNVHAQERLKLQRSIQDHQESINHLFTVFAGLQRLVSQPAGLNPSTEPKKWQLDATEAVNRMRLRTLPEATPDKAAYQPKRKPSERGPAGKLAINTQVTKVIKEDIESPLPPSPQPTQGDGSGDPTLENGRSRSDSVSNSQLLEGGFEMVEDPREADDGLLEDKNRKVMTSLQRGDMVQQLYNTSRIVGLEACEGLLVIGKNCLYMQDNFFQRSDGEIVSVAQAPDDERDPYVQLISGKDVGSHRTKHSVGDQETRHWTYAEVLSISKRRFLFRDVSIEVFFTDGRSFLLTCMSSKVRDDLYTAIVNRAPHVHSSAAVASEDAWRLDTLRNPEEGPRSLGSKMASVFNTAPSYSATKKWIRGEMSNFQYLMLVNTMAGRTFNDLTQYPVFPWVLADYTSEELDLNDPKSFRDLSKPMGCQTRLREVEYQDRFKQFAEMGDHNAPPFHYGTHYSSAMIVSSYLIRLQPFVQSYLLLQGGNFDHADRLFDSIEKAWLSASRDNMTDVRELTPEFFYLPEFLVNLNGYDFGAKQASGEIVNDVKLPPWANGDPQIFITKHREALESPYVSRHLDQWINLIFGFKQRGEAAIEATNVFQHLSYQGAKDLDSIHDPVERLASIGIIHSFGQTPYQVFQRAHPSREHLRPAVLRLDSLAESLVKLPDPLFESDEKITGLTFSSTQERLLCNGPCKLNLLPNCDRFVQWDFADHSLRFFSANTKRLLGLYENMHVGPITTVTFPDSKTIITAGTDCTIGLWGVSTSRDHILLQPKTYLFGHRAPVTILAASRVFSTLLSASTDGAILIWSLNRYHSIRVLRPPGGPAISAARISNVSGHILICQGQNLQLYTLNGHLLVDQKVCEGEADSLVGCAFYEGAGNEWCERELIFTGHTHGVANVWTLTTLNDGSWYLQLVKRLIHSDPGRDDGVASAAAISAILPMAHVVYTGDEEGRVWEWDCVLRHSSFSAGGR